MTCNITHYGDRFTGVMVCDCGYRQHAGSTGFRCPTCKINMTTRMVPDLIAECIALRAALDRAEADKAAAVLAEREKCIAAARIALDIRKAVYEAKGRDWNPELFKDLAMSQDYAFDAIEAAIAGGKGNE